MLLTFVPMMLFRFLADPAIWLAFRVTAWWSATAAG